MKTREELTSIQDKIYSLRSDIITLEASYDVEEELVVRELKAEYNWKITVLKVDFNEEAIDIRFEYNCDREEFGESKSWEWYREAVAADARRRAT